MDRASEYANGNAEFAVWLEKVDSIVSSRIGLSVFDLEDMLFIDAFEDKESPNDFVREVVIPMVRDNYGEEYAELLM